MDVDPVGMARAAYTVANSPVGKAAINWAFDKTKKYLKRRNNPPQTPRRSKRALFKRAPAYASTSGQNNGNPRRLRSKARRRYRSRGMKALKKTVGKLKAKVNCNFSRFIAFQNDAYTQTSAIARCSYGNYVFFDAAIVENALGKIPYIDPAAVATKSEMNTLVNTIPNKWCVKNHASFTLRNNYLHPVVIDTYVVKPKIASTVSPGVAVTTGLTNAGPTGGVVTTSTNLYPSHSKEFKDSWKVLKHQKQTLEAGGELILSYSEMFKGYDTKYVDTNTQTYLPKYSRCLLVRTQGVAAHDVTTSTSVSICETQLDILVKRKTEIIYPGGPIPLYRIIDTISLDTVGDDEVAAEGGAVHDEL